ncbi:MAG: RDD family protein [Anaerolineae bacterium]|nr:RDD family protein [Anaerolineae bacterium]
MVTNSSEIVSHELASIEARFAALFIDGLILAAIEGVGFMAAREPGAGVGFVVGLIYSWFFLTRYNGQTPGKMIMKIRVIKADGSAISDGDAIVRYIGYFVNAFFFIGWLWALFDESRQGWHDKLASTYVVKTS